MTIGFQPISDTPCESPFLGFETYAKSIAQIILNAPSKRFTIGIFGGYGSGKTTLMQCAKRHLPDDKFIKIDFNAWRYDQEEHLFLPFLCALCQEKRICPEPSLGTRLLAAARGLIRGVTFELDAAFAKIELSASDSLEAEKSSLKQNISRIVDGYADVHSELQHLFKVLRDKGSFLPIVVFVDDLDRCVPEKAFSLLESIKAFADVEGLIFVLGIDPRVITAYLNSKYGKDFPVSAEEYLQKIFQVPFHVPGIRHADFEAAVTGAIGTLNNEWAQKLRSLIKDKKAAKLLEALPRNIRQLKRIFNSHQLIMSFVDGEIDSDILLCILLVSVRWPEIFAMIYQHGIDFPEVQREKQNNKLLSSAEWCSYYEEVFLPTVKGTFSNIEPYLRFVGKPVTNH